MIADGLMKAPGKMRFKKFTEMVRLDGLTEWLTLIRREDELKDELQKRNLKSQEKLEVVAFSTY
jgi:hypothetical protein